MRNQLDAKMKLYLAIEHALEAGIYTAEEIAQLAKRVENQVRVRASV